MASKNLPLLCNLSFFGYIRTAYKQDDMKGNGTNDTATIPVTIMAACCSPAISFSEVKLKGQDPNKQGKAQTKETKSNKGWRELPLGPLYGLPRSHGCLSIQAYIMAKFECCCGGCGAISLFRLPPT